MKKIYRCVYRTTPKSPYVQEDVVAYGSEHAKLMLEYGDDVTHNQIEFKSVEYVMDYKSNHYRTE